MVFFFPPKTRSQTFHSTIQMKANVKSYLPPECDTHVFIIRLPHTPSLLLQYICTPCLTAPHLSGLIILFHCLIISYFTHSSASGLQCLFRQDIPSPMTPLYHKLGNFGDFENLYSSPKI